MEGVVVKVEVANAILNYLAQKPYSEVVGLVKALQESKSLQQVLKVEKESKSKDEGSEQFDCIKKELLKAPAKYISAEKEELETPEEVAELTVD